jgi:hypothetical protein
LYGYQKLNCYNMVVVFLAWTSSYTLPKIRIIIRDLFLKTHHKFIICQLKRTLRKRAAWECWGHNLDYIVIEAPCSHSYHFICECIIQVCELFGLYSQWVFLLDFSVYVRTEFLDMGGDEANTGMILES